MPISRRCQQLTEKLCRGRELDRKGTPKDVPARFSAENIILILELIFRRVMNVQPGKGSLLTAGGGNQMAVEVPLGNIIDYLLKSLMVEMT